MLKQFFKHAKQSEAIDREPTRSRESEIRRELAMRASIANKLKNYNSDEDTSVSYFTLADDETEKKRDIKLFKNKARDAWGQANPRETGKWNKEDRRTRSRANAGGLR